MSDQKEETNIIEPPSLHDKNFEIYITQYAIKNRLPMSGPLWEAALAAAKRLDYTGDRNSSPKMSFIPSEASFVKRLLTRLLRRTESPAYMSETDDIQAFLEQAPEAAALQSKIKWGMPRNNFASRMEADLLPRGEQKGSRPTPAKFKETTGWELLHRRKLKDGKKTLYARAHLLHERMGGAGVGYNLSPLTATPSGDFGANHANFAHYYLVEIRILDAYLNMHESAGQMISQLKYTVEVDFNRPPRKGTGELKKIANAYEKTALESSGNSKGAGGNGMLTHQQVMNELTRNSPSPHLDHAMSAVEAKNSEPWRVVHRRLVKNQQLWHFEDQNVALALNITYSWVENGELYGPYEVRVANILPTSLAARYK